MISDSTLVGIASVFSLLCAGAAAGYRLALNSLEFSHDLDDELTPEQSEALADAFLKAEGERVLREAELAGAIRLDRRRDEQHQARALHPSTWANGSAPSARPGGGEAPNPAAGHLNPR